VPWNRSIEGTAARRVPTMPLARLMRFGSAKEALSVLSFLDAGGEVVGGVAGAANCHTLGLVRRGRFVNVEAGRVRIGSS